VAEVAAAMDSPTGMAAYEVATGGSVVKVAATGVVKSWRWRHASSA